MLLHFVDHSQFNVVLSIAGLSMRNFSVRYVLRIHTVAKLPYGNVTGNNGVLLSIAGLSMRNCSVRYALRIHTAAKLPHGNVTGSNVVYFSRLQG